MGLKRGSASALDRRGRKTAEIRSRVESSPGPVVDRRSKHGMRSDCTHPMSLKKGTVREGRPGTQKTRTAIEGDSVVWLSSPSSSAPWSRVACKSGKRAVGGDGGIGGFWDDERGWAAGAGGGSWLSESVPGRRTGAQLKKRGTAAPPVQGTIGPSPVLCSEAFAGESVPVCRSREQC